MNLSRHKVTIMVLIAICCGLVFPTPPVARAADATVPAVDREVVDAVTPSDPRIAGIHALIEGTLDVLVEPASLFDLPLDNDAALRIESVRIQAMLRTIEEEARPKAARRGKTRKTQPQPDPLEALRKEIGTLDAASWQERVDLDRARLAFYELSAERRAELLQTHIARREAAVPRETDEARRTREAEEARRARAALEEARQREAEAARLEALRVAQEARTEAERLVNEELARLIGLEEEVAKVKADLGNRRERLEARLDTVLGWQRRVRDIKAGSFLEADDLYDALRRSLRTSREDLAQALVQLAAGGTDVPEIGPNRLLDLPSDVSVDGVSARRHQIDLAAIEVRNDEALFRKQLAERLLDEVSTLNRERLALLDVLSNKKKALVTGFTAEGLDQAKAEVGHLFLILDYHYDIAKAASLAVLGGNAEVVPLWKLAVIGLPWLLLIVALVTWRRKKTALLQRIDAHLADLDRRERRTSVRASLRAFRFLERILGPIEWLLFLAATIALLPKSALELFEVDLLLTIVGWLLGGSLVVHIVNAWAADRATDHVGEKDETGELRLRSLRLVGRITVVFILLLSLGESLVGKGTVYSWIRSTWWIALAVVFIVLIRWWREIVFVRIERVRKKTYLLNWALSGRTGWRSLIAASVGAIHLFGSTVLKAVRRWINRFELARRIHAQLYKHEIDRLGGSQKAVAFRPLGAAAFAALDPGAPCVAWNACPADLHIEYLIERVQTGRGGLVALVGGRGTGKSSFLGALAARLPNAIHIVCPQNPQPDDIRDRILQQTRPDASRAESADSMRLVLLDDAHLLARPVLGGLRPFEEIVSLAKGTDLWVVAIDAVLWPLLNRGLDVRPVFDEVRVIQPWTEEQLGLLLQDRSTRAGFSPSFEDLVDRLQFLKNEADRDDILEERRAGYYQMLWDHARGNPGLALEVWRSSLAHGEDNSVRVRALQVPDIRRIEALPDTSLFVLRSILQIPGATEDVLAQATRLAASQVRNVVETGVRHRYFLQRKGQVEVSWQWLRPILVVLERRHLLVSQ